MLDFSQPGELEVFIEEEQIASLEKRMAQGLPRRQRDGDHLQHVARQ
jgi:poly(3-hydroxyalkanoate) synthetase